MNRKTNQKGFTIVELLIVIVVIAILAAISIVAYTGIQARARTSAGQATANGVLKKIEAIGAIKGGVYYTSSVGVTGALLNTYSSAAPVASEGNIDTPTSVIAATNATTSGLTATSANSGNTVAVFACAGGANIWYWDFSLATPAQSTAMKAGAGC